MMLLMIGAVAVFAVAMLRAEHHRRAFRRKFVGEPDENLPAAREHIRAASIWWGTAAGVMLSLIATVWLLQS